ncbi:hypothetical protein CXB51_028669 [Gossypium anomalum]|uniref:Uncharacterized protein n=1 Tax=Gossypium anomalum TaxID=47600 RepID=A0A8J5Y6P3_9ROSI|nr:hypothetical protein CXB51_028669 [Gossypium anomalum]
MLNQITSSLSMSDSTFLGKWRRKCAKHLLSVPIFVVFSYLDFLDSVFCVIYKHLDFLFEGKASPCYCTTKKIDINGQFSDDNEISETLQYGKRKKLKELVVLLRFVEDLLNKSKGFEAIYSSTNRKNGDFYRVGNRWSDCGCDSCISWMKRDDPKLHVEPLEIQIELKTSSSFWTKTLFPKLSESKKIKEYQMYAVDILGHGKSPKPRDSLYTLKEHVEWIEKSLISEYKLNSFHVQFFPSKEGVEMRAMKWLTPKRLWPPTAFIWSIMVWYEHLSRCVCLLVCRNHRFWEALIKRLTSSRDVNFMVMDLTKHIHHSGWHTTHNVLYRGVKEMDKNLETLMKLKKRVHVIVGSRDKTIPPDFRHNIKTKFPDVELLNIPNAGHRSIILTRETDFAHNLFHIWQNTASHHHHHAHTEGE